MEREPQHIRKADVVTRLFQEHGDAFGYFLSQDNNHTAPEDLEKRFHEQYAGFFETEADIEAHLNERYGVEGMIDEVREKLPGWARLYVDFSTTQFLRDLQTNEDVHLSAGTDGGFHVFFRG